MSLRRILFLGIWTLTIITVGLLPACQKKEGKSSAASVPASPQEPPAYGDMLVESSIGDAKTLLPILSSDSASHQIAGLIFDGLLKYDKNIKLVGQLAQSWEVSPDGLTITFHLRPGVKWHDGVEFTAADVLFGYQTIIDPKTPSAYKGDYQVIKEAKALDKYTFQVVYKEPFAPGLGSWVGSLTTLPRHLLEGRDLMQSPLGQKPIGNGPYRFQEWKTGSQIKLSANPDYWEGRPYLNAYLYRIIPDSATSFLELKAGNVDFLGLTPLQFARQTDKPDFKNLFNKYKYLSFGYTYLGYNLKNPLFQDRRVRQALSYAINRDEIVQGVLMGLGQPAAGPYKPGTIWENPKVKPYPYDPVKARRLLAEAGWTDADNDGVLEKGGQPFSFTIITNQGNDTRAKAAEIIQFRLKDVGIKVNIRIIEWAAFVYEFINKRKFEAVLLGWSTTPEPDQYDIWHSSKTAPEELNFISYQNPEADKLLMEGRRSFDTRKRQEIYYRFQEILAEDQPYAFLYVPESVVAVSNRFRGIEPAPLGLTHNFIRWYVPKPAQKYTLAP